MSQAMSQALSQAILSPELSEKIRRIELRAKRLVSDSLSGDYHSVFKGRGMTFDEVRPYQDSDDVRSIDWNVTARMGDAYVKQFIEERELSVIIAIDMSASQDFGSRVHSKAELAAELCAVLSFAAHKNNDKVGLLLFAEDIKLFLPARTGRKHVLRLVREVLSQEALGRSSNFSQAFTYLQKLVKRRSILILLSDFLGWQAQWNQAALNSLSKKHDFMAIQLKDPLEETFPAVGLLHLEDAETGEVRVIDSRSKAWRERFQHHRETLQQELQANLRSAKVDFVGLSSQEDYLTVLNNFFKQRLRRRR